MRCGLIVLVVGLAVAVPAGAQTLDKEKLRKVARLPAVSGQFGIALGGDAKFLVMGERSDARAEIDRVKAALKGGPSDATLYYALGEFHDQLREETPANDAYAKAIELCCLQLKTQPNDGAVLALYARALHALGKEAESEATLRQAVTKDPEAWQPCLDLGSFQQGKAVRELLGVAPSAISNGRQLVTRIWEQKPSAERIARWEQVWEEGSKYQDRAVALAPEEATVYLPRAHARGLQAMISGALRRLQGEKLNPLAALFSPGYIADVRQAARLRPDDYHPVGLAAIAEVTVALMAKGEQWGPGPEGALKALPKKVRKAVRADIARLEAIGKDRDARSAAGALVVLGGLYATLGDFARAVRRLERAVALEPARDNAWDLLATLLLRQEQRERALKVCQDHLRCRDSAWNRCWLAYAYTETGQSAKAEEQLRLALKVTPDDFGASLGLAALLLKRSDAAGALDEAANALARARESLGEIPPPDKQSECKITLGVYLALRGWPEDAARLVRQVLESDPENQRAKDALKALGQ